MRFVDFLKTTVLLCAGAATTLAVLTVVSAGRDQNDTIVFYLAGWWLVAALIGGYLGRHRQASSPIAKLLADSHAATMMPDIRPMAIVINRLWPLFLCVLAAAALSFVAPQIPGIATGFVIIWSLIWRHQDAAVLAIEGRDGVTFFIEPTSFLRPMKLQRMPGLRREVPS
ncbi:MAG TPA: hypothetical protein VNT22_09450 [Baekduia sp.]|nr:hypothetical protein [Baekduia sp.]